MQPKNLRKTNGTPLYLGIAGAVLLLVGSILQSGVSTASMNAVFSQLGIEMSISQTSVLVGALIGFLIYPGIFLILLLVGMNQPKRGTAFAVVWMVFSGLGTLSGLYSLATASAEIKGLAAQLVPGGFYLYELLIFAGEVCVLFSCILFLKRLHTPPEEVETSDAVNQ